MFEKMFKKYALEEEKLPKRRIMKNKAEVMRLAGIEENTQKARKLPKRAVIIPVAAAVVAVGTVSAGAAGFNLFDAFQRYFSGQTEEAETVDPGVAGLAEYEKVVELDDYTLSVNGFMGDRFSMLVYYDITYKADKYFENGELKQEFLERSPVHFFLMNKSGGGGSHEKITVSGNTVSYVQEYTASEGFDELDGGEYELKLRVTFADTTDLFAGLSGNLCDPVMMDAKFPIPEELSFSTDADILLADKKFHLSAVDISPLSVGFSFDVSLSEEDNNTLYDGEIALLMKDGTEKDLSGNEKNWHFDETSAKLIAHYGLPIKTEDIAGVRYAGCTFKIENGAIVQTEIAESAENADIPNESGNDTEADPAEDETSRVEDDIYVIKKSESEGVVYIS